MSEPDFKDIDQFRINDLAMCIGDDGAIYIEDENTEIRIADRHEAETLRDWLNKALSTE